MRASVVHCAILAVLTGCTKARPALSDHSLDSGSVVPAEPAPPPAPRRKANTEPGRSVFVTGPDGGATSTLRDDAPNMRYAQLDRTACLAELERRQIDFEQARVTAWTRRAWSVTARRPKKKPAKPNPHLQGARSAKGRAPADVIAPVRLRGPLHGISIHSGLPDNERETSTTEIFDCRLVLALDDFAAILEEHDIVEVIHMSASPSPRARAALAVDVGVFKKKDGSVLNVARDFNGRIGASTCAAGVDPDTATPEAIELREIVCDSVRRGLFHIVLTPNFNADHKSHLHLELSPDATWMLLK